MVTQFGMSERIGQLNFGDDETQPFLGYSIAQGRHYSEETAAKIDEEVHRMVTQAYEKTVALLRENEDKLHALAEALLEKEIIEQAEMLRIIGITKEEATPDRVQLDQDQQPHFSLGHNEDDGSTSPNDDQSNHQHQPESENQSDTIPGSHD
jgi:cell division protease FtsH